MPAVFKAKRTMARASAKLRQLMDCGLEKQIIQGAEKLQECKARIFNWIQVVRNEKTVTNTRKKNEKGKQNRTPLTAFLVISVLVHIKQ